MINLYGFSLLRNGIKYDYSFRESLLSLSPIVKNIYLALDPGEDSTEEEIKKFSFIKIIPSVWDMNLKKGLVLSTETNKALHALRVDLENDKSAWGIYLQADEVLHQDDYDLIKSDIEKAEKSGCDALSFRYLHFWQTHHHLAIAKNWYPEEIRAIKLNSQIQSYGDAQSFINHTKIYQSEARVFHYGHVRDQSIYKNKMEEMSKLYDSDATKSKYYNAKDRDKEFTDCLLFFADHPQVMKERILKMGDIWQLPLTEEVYIEGDSEDYSKKMVDAIHAKKIYWVKSINDIPKDKRHLYVKMNLSLVDKLLKRSFVCKKMKSKKARDWSKDFLLTLKLSEKNIGLKA